MGIRQMVGIPLGGGEMLDLPNVYISAACLKEISKCFAGFGNRAKAMAWLRSRLLELNEPKFDVYRAAWRQFEQVDEFLNITYRNKQKNVRILIKREGEISKLLLCAFEENNDSDYDRAKELARKREKEWKWR